MGTCKTMQVKQILWFLTGLLNYEHFYEGGVFGVLITATHKYFLDHYFPLDLNILLS